MATCASDGRHRGAHGAGRRARRRTVRRSCAWARVASGSRPGCPTIRTRSPTSTTGPTTSRAPSTRAHRARRARRLASGARRRSRSSWATRSPTRRRHARRPLWSPATTWSRPRRSARPTRYDLLCAPGPASGLDLLDELLDDVEAVLQFRLATSTTLDAPDPTARSAEATWPRPVCYKGAVPEQDAPKTRRPRTARAVKSARSRPRQGLRPAGDRRPAAGCRSLDRPRRRPAPIVPRRSDRS